MAWRWLRGLVAVAVAYFGWGAGFDLLEDAWLTGGGQAFAVALAVPLAAGAAGRLLAGPGRLLSTGVVVVVVLDTLAAFFQGGTAEPLGRDLLLRAVPLVALLGSVALVSLWRGQRRLPSD